LGECCPNNKIKRKKKLDKGSRETASVTRWRPRQRQITCRRKNKGEKESETVTQEIQYHITNDWKRGWKRGREVVPRKAAQKDGRLGDPAKGKGKCNFSRGKNETGKKKTASLVEKKSFDYKIKKSPTVKRSNRCRSSPAEAKPRTETACKVAKKLKRSW